MVINRKFFLRLLWVLLIFTLIWVVISKKNIETKQSKPTLKSIVEQTMAGSEGQYGIVIKNFETGESYFSNEHEVFESGSLYKLWVMAAVFQQIQAGKLTEDEVLSKDISVLNEDFNIDPEEAELTEGAITLAVRDALNQMITISHNYAALLLTQKIKLSTVTAFLKTNGLTQSAVGIGSDSPTTTPADIALFYEKLYRSELANPEYTGKMIELLKKQQLNDGLPKNLPPEIKIAHKTGDIGWFKHDAGIVYLPEQESSKKDKKDKEERGDYLIVVLSESDYPPGAQERIALLSKAVFDYFNRL